MLCSSRKHFPYSANASKKKANSFQTEKNQWENKVYIIVNSYGTLQIFVCDSLYKVKCKLNVKKL